MRVFNGETAGCDCFLMVGKHRYPLSHKELTDLLTAGFEKEPSSDFLHTMVSGFIAGFRKYGAVFVTYKQMRAIRNYALAGYPFKLKPRLRGQDKRQATVAGNAKVVLADLEKRRQAG